MQQMQQGTLTVTIDSLSYLISPSMFSSFNPQIKIEYPSFEALTTPKFKVKKSISFDEKVTIRFNTEMQNYIELVLIEKSNVGDDDEKGRFKVRLDQFIGQDTTKSSFQSDTMEIVFGKVAKLKLKGQVWIDDLKENKQNTENVQQQDDDDDDDEDDDVLTSEAQIDKKIKELQDELTRLKGIEQIETDNLKRETKKYEEMYQTMEIQHRINIEKVEQTAICKSRIKKIKTGLEGSINVDQIVLDLKGDGVSKQTYFVCLRVADQSFKSHLLNNCKFFIH